MIITYGLKQFNLYRAGNYCYYRNYYPAEISFRGHLYNAYDVRSSRRYGHFCENNAVVFVKLG
jgi:hypothetical protein